MNDDWITPRQASELMGISTKSVARAAERGRVTTTKTVGGHRRYLRSSVLAVALGEPVARVTCDHPGPLEYRCDLDRWHVGTWHQTDDAGAMISWQEASPPAGAKGVQGEALDAEEKWVRAVEMAQHLSCCEHADNRDECDLTELLDFLADG